MDKKIDRADSAWPIVGGKNHEQPSVFRPEALLREARRQRQLPQVAVPEICVLDPDGDVVRHLKRTGTGRIHEGWACYHTELLAFDLDGIGEVGIVGCAVGAPFAVLVAEQLFASSCRLLISVTSAGQIAPIGPTPYFVLIDRALRDEGTSYHYLPGSTFAEAPDAPLLARVEQAGRTLPSIALHRCSRHCDPRPAEDRGAGYRASAAEAGAQSPAAKIPFQTRTGQVDRKGARVSELEEGRLIARVRGASSGR